MERLWKDEAELKATVLRLDPTCREAAKEFGRLVAGNPSIDQGELFSMSCARACSAMGSTDPMALLKLSGAQIKAIGAVGLAISQWWIEAQKDNVEDEELAELLDDRSKIEAVADARIARRAYEIYLERQKSGRFGDSVSDWHEARKEVLGGDRAQ